MYLNVTQEGATVLWQYILGIVEVQEFGCHLFSTPATLQHTDTYNTWNLLECKCPGYEIIHLGTGSPPWTLAVAEWGAQAQHSVITWFFTGACTIYGYWLSDNTLTYSIWGTMFDQPYVYGDNGGGFALLLAPNLISCLFDEPLCPAQP